MDSDDEIELLKQPHSRDSEGEVSDNLGYQHHASVNPNIFTQSRSLSEETSVINPGSYHALQTAFSSLQRKHNDQAKKYQELKQRHRLMQSNIPSMEQKAMDPTAASNPAVGAGGSHDEETFTAEIRAKQGYIQHLERELLRGTNSLSKCNEEILRLKKQYLDVDSQRQNWAQERERLQLDIQGLTERLQSSQEECINKDHKILQLEESLHSTTIQSQSMEEKLEEITIQLANTDRVASSVKNKDDKIQELLCTLQNADRERQTLMNHLKDLEKRISDKDREILALEAKHKQYVIENDINRKHVQAQGQRGAEGLDELDGENEMIEKAFNMIKVQQYTIHELKLKLDEQKTLISELYKMKGKSIGESYQEHCDKSIEEREDAQGESFHPQMEDQKPPSPIYANFNPRADFTPLDSPNHCPATAIQGSPSSPMVSHTGPGDYRGLGIAPATISPRINDAVKPTGNTNVPRMIASEHSLPVAGIVGGNVVDAKNVLTSPRGRVAAIGVQNNVSEVTQQSLRGHSTSPRSVRTSSPVSTIDQQTDIVNVNSGARPRLRANYVPQSNFEHNAGQTSPSRHPDRMTQSEIIIRDRSSGIQDNTVYQPLPTLELSRSHENIHNLMSRSHENIYPQGQNNGNYRLPQRSTANQHEYENVYEVNNPNECPNNDYDHSVYVNDSDVLMQNRIAVEHTSQQPQPEEQVNSVSALKICPVCNNEFSRLSMDQFQRHVFDCFDNADEPPVTLQPSATNAQGEEDRTCPMCGASFPLTVQQEVYEQHVLAHFGEEPLIERFEMLN